MIEVSHLTRRYASNFAVRDLSFTIEGGTVCGFIGPNGAGKSTTLNMLTGCLEPTSGTISICGHDLQREPIAARRCLGFLPEQPPLYPDMTPYEYLRFVASARGVKRSEADVQVRWAMSAVQIKQMSDRLIRNLSKGYRQRVGIAQALLGRPQVIILDEPTVGLDPIQIIEIRALIKELGKTHTVLLSSHILSEVQAVCEQVLILSKGRLVAFDAPEKLEKLLLSSGGVSFQVEAGKADAEALFAREEGLSGWEVREADGVCSVTAELADGQDAKAVCGRLTMAFAAKGLPVFEMRTKKANLEDVFLELTESGAAEDTPQDFAESETESEAEEQ